MAPVYPFNRWTRKDISARLALVKVYFSLKYIFHCSRPEWIHFVKNMWISKDIPVLSHYVWCWSWH